MCAQRKPVACSVIRKVSGRLRGGASATWITLSLAGGIPANMQPSCGRACMTTWSFLGIHLDPRHANHADADHFEPRRPGAKDTAA